MSNLRKYENPFKSTGYSTKSSVAHSGNADVDIIMEVNTMPIAYAMLCSLRATNKLSEHEFESALKRLKKLVDDDRNSYHNDPGTAKIYHLE
ncbi:hypothetical protein SAMN05421663_101508 [Terribacillus halophilus]|uniref:Uncharacterized protein n=1 Tax=Terribacillus halophilus TaxID=361279 RepID=A0A1G6J8B7_9BACI|nr:hypothetical protein [Terribacillus halophilus]SDC14970.1 hypothetical protein SAMN05421663_101508 [Terribacillus halophilus]